MSVFGICVFLWLADIVDNLSYRLTLLSILLLIGWVIVGFIKGVGAIENGEDTSRVMVKHILGGKKILIISLVTSLLACVIPSKQTIYMIGGTIAGSEIVGKVAGSKEYQKLMELFNLTLDKQIKEIKGELNVK